MLKRLKKLVAPLVSKRVLMYEVGNLVDVMAYAATLYMVGWLVPIIPALTVLQAIILGGVMRLTTLALVFGGYGVMLITLKVLARRLYA